MLTIDKFEKLLEKPESTLLDFKKSMYEFSNDFEYKNTAKFVKDIISFCNTIRNDSSHIIIGVEDCTQGKILHGLDVEMDDSVLQQKIIDKILPRPKFLYYTINFQNKRFGIFEFPIVKYSSPLVSVLKMKGLEIGKAYYRQGTSNTEALTSQVIHINDWFKGLPHSMPSTDLLDEVSALIKDLTNKERKLSQVMTDILVIAQKNDLADLKSFVSTELVGFEKADVVCSQEKYLYRMQKVYISHQNVELNLNYNLTNQMIKNEFANNDNFFEFKLFFSKPILQIEDLLKKFMEKDDGTMGSIKMMANSTFPKQVKKDYMVYAYFFIETIQSLYDNIRQKTIDNLMKVDLASKSA